MEDVHAVCPRHRRCVIAAVVIDDDNLSANDSSFGERQLDAVQTLPDAGGLIPGRDDD
ncbi:MAG: hypothetical protein WA695_08845 [Candidatus Dormiibacterota bacterium]